jgi:hypothetical protein
MQQSLSTDILTSVAIDMTPGYLVIRIRERMDTIGSLKKTVQESFHALEDIAGVDP